MSASHHDEDLATELERCRAMLLQSAKMAELGALVAGLVHEMNQPLLGIKAFAQMLGRELPDSEARRRVEFMEEQATVLERLVGRLRDFSRRTEVDRKARTSLHAALERSLAILAHRIRKAGVQTDLVLPDRLPPLCMEAVHAQQLLVNLLTNAADAVEGQSVRRIRVAAEQRGARLLLVVADSGPGIPPEARAQVFEPFFTTKDHGRGTGLGLPISNEIVRAYDGELALLSNAEAEALAGPGLRTAITVLLAADPEEAPHDA